MDTSMVSIGTVSGAGDQRPASAEFAVGSQSRFGLFTRKQDVLNQAQEHVRVVGHGFADASLILD